MRIILPHGWVRRNSTKDCVDTSVEITGIINSAIQKTKRLKFGATLIVSLIEERDLLLTEFSLLYFNLFFQEMLSQQLIQATEDPVYSAFLKGSLNRLPNFDEDELLKTIQRLPNKQCASIQYPRGF